MFLAVIIPLIAIVPLVIVAAWVAADRNDARRRAPEYVTPRLPELAVATAWRRKRP